jgi:hypothetical protein
MWEPLHLTTLRASTAYYRDSFTFSLLQCSQYIVTYLLKARTVEAETQLLLGNTHTKQ